MTALLVAAALVGTPTDATSYCLRGTMADGSWTRAGSVAHNGYPLGTRLSAFPPVFGRVRWIVRDRIGWGTSVDFWAPSCALSRQFGRRTIHVSRGWPVTRMRHSRARVRARSSCRG